MGTATQPRPVTEQVPAAPDNVQGVRHLVCLACFPGEAPVSPVALCGEQLLGYRVPNSVPCCVMCDDVVARFKCGEPLACGHYGKA